MNIAKRTVLGFSLTAAVAACNSAPIDPAEEQIAADGNQGMMASTQSTALAEVVFEGVSVSDPLQAAEQLGAPSQLWPSGCTTRSKDPTDPDSAHVTFADCTGPFGLVHIDGDEEVTFSSSAAGALHVAITGVNLGAEGAPIAFSATADVTFPTATTREVVWQGSWSRTNEAGDVVDHTSDLMIAVDIVAGCRTLDGTALTTVAGRQVDSTLRGYRVCRYLTTGAEGCPSGSVIHTGEPSGKVVTLDFDASDVAQVTGPAGDTFEVALACVSIGR
jgi:hypothetical protein